MMRHSARDRILQKLRAVTVPASPLPDTAGFYESRPGEPISMQVERLVLTLTNAMAEVHRTTAAELPTALMAVIREKGLQRLAVGREILDTAGWCSASGGGIRSVCEVHAVQEVHASQADLFHTVDAGLTRSHAAIAETGTVVLWSGPASPRLLSLVPPVHIVIVEAQRVFATLFDLMHQEDWAQGLPTNVVLVSSPSKTADIQQTLAYGAHGPKQLIVMLVEAH